MIQHGAYQYFLKGGVLYRRGADDLLTILRYTEPRTELLGFEDGRLHYRTTERSLRGRTTRTFTCEPNGANQVEIHTTTERRPVGARMPLLLATVSLGLFFAGAAWWGAVFGVAGLGLLYVNERCVNPDIPTNNPGTA